MFTIPAEVKALSFDIWGTLLYGNRNATLPRLRVVFSQLGHDNIEPVALRKAYLTAERHYNDLAEEEGLDHGMAARIDMMYRELGILDKVPGAERLATIQSEVSKLRQLPEYLPFLIEADLPGTLEALRAQGYTLGLLSNTGMDNGQVMRPIMDKLGILEYFKVQVFSADDGRAKPNPELFLDTVKKLGVEPSEVLHIGDNVNADYRGATEAGLHGVVYSSTGLHGIDKPHITTMKELLSKDEG